MTSRKERSASDENRVFLSIRLDTILSKSCAGRVSSDWCEVWPRDPMIGPRDPLDKVETMQRNHFETTRLAVGGPDRDSEWRFLKRTIRWTELKCCFTWFIDFFSRRAGHAGHSHVCIGPCCNERMTRPAVKDSGQSDANPNRHQVSHGTQQFPPRRHNRLVTQYPVKNFMREITRADEDWSKETERQEHWRDERFSKDRWNCWRRRRVCQQITPANARTLDENKRPSGKKQCLTSSDHPATGNDDRESQAQLASVNSEVCHHQCIRFWEIDPERRDHPQNAKKNVECETASGHLKWSTWHWWSKLNTWIFRKVKSTFSTGPGSVQDDCRRPGGSKTWANCPKYGRNLSWLETVCDGDSGIKIRTCTGQWAMSWGNSVNKSRDVAWRQRMTSRMRGHDCQVTVTESGIWRGRTPSQWHQDASTTEEPRVEHLETCTVIGEQAGEDTRQEISCNRSAWRQWSGSRRKCDTLSSILNCWSLQHNAEQFVERSGRVTGLLLQFGIGETKWSRIENTHKRQFLRPCVQLWSGGVSFARALDVTTGQQYGTNGKQKSVNIVGVVFRGVTTWETSTSWAIS